VKFVEQRDHEWLKSASPEAIVAAGLRGELDELLGRGRYQDRPLDRPDTDARGRKTLAWLKRTAQSDPEAVVRAHAAGELDHLLAPDLTGRPSGRSG
jgi:hypothetical protein